jgi:hypothetical protein
MFTAPSLLDVVCIISLLPVGAIFGLGSALALTIYRHRDANKKFSKVLTMDRPGVSHFTGAEDPLEHLFAPHHTTSEYSERLQPVFGLTCLFATCRSCSTRWGRACSSTWSSASLCRRSTTGATPQQHRLHAHDARFLVSCCRSRGHRLQILNILMQGPFGRDDWRRGDKLPAWAKICEWRQRVTSRMMHKCHQTLPDCRMMRGMSACRYGKASWCWTGHLCPCWLTAAEQGSGDMSMDSVLASFGKVDFWSASAALCRSELARGMARSDCTSIHSMSNFGRA